MTTTAEPSETHRRAPLARGADGDPFAVTVEACAWRVRRFRQPGHRGAPELVYGDDAMPLEIPIDTPIAEFREVVGNRGGRYRLDATDVEGVAVPKVPAAYLQIDPPEAARALPPQPAVASVDPMIEVMREMMKVNAELARTNSELARTVIERFPAMIDSAAGLVRAADGAGLPQRVPSDTRNAAAVAVPVVEGDQGDDDADAIGDGWPATVARVVDQLVPMVQMVIAHRMGGATPRNANAKPAPRGPTPTAAAPTAPAAPPADESPIPTPTPTPTPDQLAHFVQIQAALTPREGQIARALLAELRPTEVAAWLEELSALAVPDAVALIRRHLASSAPRTPPRSGGGAPPTPSPTPTQTPNQEPTP